ncbi:DUF6725 family protein [Isoptericola aurantiacus]|uniref:DUF6725 family protein n=1 Tax=Isoptericola aurantiacus TaxID=3377839 RepID=UPI003839F1E9
MGTSHPHPGSSAWRDWPAGTRCVVRRRLPPCDGSGKRWTDVIGVVLAVAADGVMLRRDPARESASDAGTEVHIPAAEIEAARPLPPRPERRRRS